MYNRYIGNTGKVYRMEEKHAEPEHKKPAVHNAGSEPRHKSKPQHHIEVPKPHDTGFSLGKILGGGSLTKSIDAILPFGLETSDIVLLILFLFLYIESGDEEFLIILGFLAYSIYKDGR